MNNSLKKVLVFGIDNFSLKNRYQVEELNKHGYLFIFETLNSRSDSYRNFAGLEASGNSLEITTKGFLHAPCRIGAAIKLMISHKVHHVEVYPGGRFAFFYTVLSRLMKRKVIVVERGDLLDWDEKPASLRFSMWLCYRLATIVWYREPYMEKVLEKLRVKQKVFIHNAGPSVPVDNSRVNRDIDFLWVNRLIEQRRSDWFVDILDKQKFKKTCNFVIGIEKSKKLQNQVEYVRRKAGSNIELEEFRSPGGFYQRSRFFVLPATVVFCNHALLEAMAHGVVPIVSESNGTDLIVQDGVNGFICEHSSQGLESAMLRALNLDDCEWGLLSQQARETVLKKFSRKIWGEKVDALYNEVDCSR